MYNINLTFLTKNETWIFDQLKILKKYGTKASLSDFSIVLGASVSNDHTSEGNELSDRTGWYWTKTTSDTRWNLVVGSFGDKVSISCQSRYVATRPVLSFLNEKLIPTYCDRGSSQLEEIEYGEYPQTIADQKVISYLNTNFYLKTLTKTGKEYTIDSRKYNEYDKEFSPIKLTEYEYDGQKYVRVKVNSHINGDKVTLSDGLYYKNDDYVWIKVEPIKWIKEPEKNLFLSKKCLFSGVRFDKENAKYFDSNFDETEINNFLQNFFIKDIIPIKFPKYIKDEQPFTINNFTFVDKDGNKKKKRIVVKAKNKN